MATKAYLRLSGLYVEHLLYVDFLGTLLFDKSNIHNSNYSILACSSCHGGGTQSARVQVSNIITTNTPMNQWVTELGWVFQGNCGCRNNLNIFRNPNVEGFEIWMNLNGTRFEVRRNFGRDTKILGIGYTANYQQIYRAHIK